MSVKVILENVRGAYVHIKKPHASKKFPDDVRYRITALIEKGDSQVKEIKKAMKDAAVEKFGEKVDLKSLKSCLRDGDETEKEIFQGHYYINITNRDPVSVLNQQNKPADSDDWSEYCYSGAYFHLSVNFAAYDAGTKGVTAYLNGVMLHRRGDRLGDRSDPKEDFRNLVSGGGDNTDDDWGDSNTDDDWA